MLVLARVFVRPTCRRQPKNSSTSSADISGSKGTRSSRMPSMPRRPSACCSEPSTRPVFQGPHSCSNCSTARSMTAFSVDTRCCQLVISPLRIARYSDSQSSGHRGPVRSFWSTGGTRRTPGERSFRLSGPAATARQVQPRELRNSRSGDSSHIHVALSPGCQTHGSGSRHSLLEPMTPAQSVRRMSERC